MNIKLLSSLGLLSPEPLASGSGAGVESPTGNVPGASPASENFYSATDEGGNASASGAPAGAETPVGGDGAPDFTDKGAEGQGEVQAQPALDDQGQPVKPAVEAKPATLKLDAESIAALREAVAPKQAAVAQEPARMSAEQLKAVLNPVEVTDDIVAGIRDENPEVVKATLQNFANAAVKNAVSIARVMLQQAEKRVESALGPIAQQHQQAQQEAVKTTFFAKYPDLTKYGKLVVQAAQEIGADPASANFTPDQSMKAVADRVIATLTEYGVTLTPANPGAGGQQQVPKPNKLSPPGRSGGDTNGQRGKGNDADADIYKR